MLPCVCVRCPRLNVSSCGSGLSGEALTEAGHVWVGVDISQAMLGEEGVSVREEGEV